MLDPRLYCEREARRKYRADQQDARDGLLGDVMVAVQHVGYQHADAREQAERDAGHAHAGHDPMQPVRDGDAVDEEPGGLHEGHEYQDPEAELGLSVPAVTGGEGEDDLVVDDAGDDDAMGGVNGGFRRGVVVDEPNNNADEGRDGE